MIYKIIKEVSGPHKVIILCNKKLCILSKFYSSFK